MDTDVSHAVQAELDALNERVTALEEGSPAPSKQDGEDDEDEEDSTQLPFGQEA